MEGDKAVSRPIDAAVNKHTTRYPRVTMIADVARGQNSDFLVTMASWPHVPFLLLLLRPKLHKAVDTTTLCFS